MSHSEQFQPFFLCFDLGSLIMVSNLALGVRLKFPDTSRDSGRCLKEPNGHLSTTKTARKKTKDKIVEYTKDIDDQKKYRKRIGILKKGTKTFKGQGIYTQQKRNACKINPQTGVYGNLIIDVP